MSQYNYLPFSIALVFLSVVYIIPVPSIQAVVEEPYTFGAHRGDSEKYTENTLEAISHALKNPQYKFIEFDVQFTKDNKIIIFHDRSLFRLHGKISFVKNHTYEELQILSNNSIPLYKEAMDLIGSTKKPLNIEIKTQGDFERDKLLVNFLVSDLKQRRMLQNTLLSSISTKVVNYIKENHSNLRVGQIFWIHPSTYFPGKFFTQRLYANVTETGADYVMLHSHNLRNYQSLLDLKPQGTILVFWYFDEEMYVVHATSSDKLWGTT